MEAERLRVDDTGKVGIGVGAPSATLQIESSDSKKLLITNTDFDQATQAGSTFDIGFGATSGVTYTDVRALIFGRSDWGDLILQRGGGNVGIGTSNPSSFAGDCELAVAKAGGARFGISGSSRTFFVQGNTSNDQLDFGRRTGSNTNDDIIFSARADGITFNGDTAAANELNDYEEGTFTPTITDATAYATQLGYYTKVGRLVTFAIRVQPTAGTGSASALEIGGLPFTSASISAGPYGGAFRSYGTLVDEGTIVNLNYHIPTNNTAIRPLSNTSAIATNNAAVNFIGNFLFNGFYYTA